jgi:hypothetical protein
MFLHRQRYGSAAGGVASETVTALDVTGLLVRDTFGRLALTNDGRMSLWVLMAARVSHG